jgi:hypothetical protein
MKLVHKSLTPWISGLGKLFTVLFVAAIAQDAVAQSQKAHYNPSEGFKPAKANLTEAFLQMAESLEYHGSPEPYLRHIQKEHERVSKLYEQRTGKALTNYLPAHMTEAYFNKLIENWNLLSKPLGLNEFAKQIGGYMREGIMGTRLSGTLAVQIFNEHQKQVAARMRGDTAKPAGFEQLRIRLQHDLEFGKDTIDTSGYETTRRDAVSYSSFIDGAFRKKFSAIEAAAKPEKAALIREVVAGVFLDLGQMVQSELEIAILESALIVR